MLSDGDKVSLMVGGVEGELFWWTEEVAGRFGKPATICQGFS